MKSLLFFVIILLNIFSACGKSETVKIKDIKTVSDSINAKANKNPQQGKYAVAKYFTPVLNTSNFESVYGGKNGKTLKRAKNGLIKELEYTAYPGTVFTILEEYPKDNHFIYRVYVKEYDIPELKIDLFIDSRFVNLYDEKPEERKIELTTEKQIYDYLDRSMGSLYVWGANNIDGIKQMLEFYPPRGELSEKEKKEWSIEGLDCSGLLFEATNGYTPRNTHQLVYFGEPVEVEGLTAKQIVNKIEPLDLIVWKGHIIIVYDKSHTIESSFTGGGVVKKDLKTVITNLLSKRKIVNEWNDNGGSQFVIRRWKKILNK